MTIYKYDRHINRRKKTEIYTGNIKHGEITGKYRNILKMFQDIIFKNVSSITYELTDNNHNLVVVSDEVTSLFSKKKVKLHYYDRSEWNTILVKETKFIDIGDVVTFTYKNVDYVIKKKPFKPAILYTNNIPIGEWKINVKNREVVFDLNTTYLEKKYLFSGILHSYFYDKN
ncbi:hypothetical protein AQ616_01905 [Oceanobacillus sp. E9]|uniref:tubby C-terminal domain-like protein n=2 Tax=unclassified Oceanobacillus TaxID=2630292 RepID=UPI00084E6EC2|nr:hypothetical protein [Oceanobacillus sp. E9]MBT2599754.1 hypothetical protein [Oceanobacillus sp. ISL-74]OEH56297.1 hypothetical protein AQ616_01905 [Oceanobacillus sp. E9]